MTCQLIKNGFTFERFEAVDGTTLSDGDVIRLNESARRPLHRGELVCVLSHMAVWLKALESGHPYVSVLEDDVQLGPSPTELVQGLSRLNRLEPDWHLLYVEDKSSTSAFYQVCPAVHIAPELDKTTRIRNAHLGGDLFRVGPQLGSFSYILSRSGIAKCLEGFRTVLNPLDIQLGQLNRRLIAILWRRSDVWFADDGTSDTK